MDDREGSRTTNTTTSAATADATTTTNGDGGSNIRDNGGNQHQFQYEHQILLSNVIACRLKIGGNEMAQKAVEDAKQVKHASYYYRRISFNLSTFKMILYLILPNSSLGFN